MYMLRELERSDLPEVNRWRRDPALIAQLTAPYRFINGEVDERWFDAYMNDRAHAIRCAVVEAERPEQILGLVSLTNIDWVHRSAYFGIMIGREENQGRGLGSFAVKAILNHAFRDMNLNRVELTVLADNQRARRLYEKAGFVQEGCFRQALFKEGSYRDLLFMAVLRKEWEALGD